MRPFLPFGQRTAVVPRGAYLIPVEPVTLRRASPISARLSVVFAPRWGCENDGQARVRTWVGRKPATFTAWSFWPLRHLPLVAPHPGASCGSVSLSIDVQIPIPERKIGLYAFFQRSRWRESNPRPAVYKTAALPLSYTGVPQQRIRFRRIRNVQHYTGLAPCR